MRKVLILLAAVLSGCASTLSAMVDERAQQQCEEEHRTAPGPSGLLSLHPSGLPAASPQ
ncbi:MAG: hypothetical protein K2P70_14495 [Hyphomonadaceae bacterium]|nr:hypothetical protein [Hyphomonadaceae bacterium]